MKRHTLIVIFLILSGLSYGQSPQQIDSLLTSLCQTKNSKELSTRSDAIKIISYGDRVLPILKSYFIDTTLTEIKSDCQNLMLTKGEVAIILADRIEYMPYARLTNIQNCLLQFCEDNPNFIEYYFHAIRRDDVKKFQDRYTEWLTSKERKKWRQYFNNKKKKTK